MNSGASSSLTRSPVGAYANAMLCATTRPRAAGERRIHEDPRTFGPHAVVRIEQVGIRPVESRRQSGQLVDDRLGRGVGHRGSHLDRCRTRRTRPGQRPPPRAERHAVPIASSPSPRAPPPVAAGRAGCRSRPSRRPRRRACRRRYPSAGCRLAVNPRRRSRCRRRSFHDGNGGPSARTSARPKRPSALVAERVEESDEIYVLSLDADPSVKVRDDVLDVKGLLAIDDDGLEQWVPVAKLRLPCPARRPRRRARPAAGGRAAARPRGLHRRGPPRRSRAGRCAARRRGAQATHPLHGRRLHGRDQRDPNRPGLDAHRSLSNPKIPRACWRSCARLGLATRANVCMARGLKALVGFGTVRHAVIDVGTELGQGPRRRAPRRRHVEGHRRPRDREPPR